MGNSLPSGGLEGGSVEVGDERNGGEPRVTTVDALCSTLETGDLLFLSGVGIGSVLTRVFTLSRWSHVGMVEHQPRVSAYRFFWEAISTPEAGVPDVYTKTDQKAGVRLAEIANRLRVYIRVNGREGRRSVVGVMRLVCTLRAGHNRRMEELHRRLSQFQESEWRKAFELSKLSLARAEFSAILGEEEHHEAAAPSKYFCSQLVITTYKAMGLLDPRTDASHYTPALIARYPGNLAFAKGFRLGPELELYEVVLSEEEAQPARPREVLRTLKSGDEEEEEEEADPGVPG